MTPPPEKTVITVTTPQASYLGMVRYLNGGGRLPPARIREILRAAGRTADALIDSVLGDASGGGPAPGDGCPCGASIVVRRSWRSGGQQVQRLVCGSCGAHAGTRRVPAGIVRRRNRQSIRVTTPVTEST
jgi:hypothetical protein